MQCTHADSAVCHHRTTSVSALMYVKEDLIIPHHISFYDLISSKARGKSGPLFHFDVHEDIRAQNDARIEKDESHAGGLTA
jgi:protein FAM50